MDEAQCLCMQRQAVNGRCAGAVATVAADGALDVGQMHADLVLAAGVELQFQQCAVATGFECGISRHGLFPFFGIIGGIYFMSRIFGQITANNALWLLRNTLSHSHISTLKHHIIPIMLHCFFGFHAFGKEHQSGSVLVEPMHDKHLLAWVDAFHPLAQ